jgi:hypothetical protein
MDDLDFALKSVPFTVIIPAGTRSFRFEHNKPVSHLSLLSGEGRKKDEFSADLDAIVRWVTGGEDGMRNHETDIYGVVQLKMEDLSSQIFDIATLTESDTESDNKRAQQEFKALKDAHVKKTKKALTEAQEMADSRVKRALRITHNNLMKQWEVMQQDGKGKYTPSIAEAVGAHVLAQEMEKAGAKRKEMVERLMQVANNTVIM